MIRPKSLIKFVFTLVFFLVGISLFWIYFNLRAYASFNRQELVAVAVCKVAPDKIYDMVLEIKWIKNKKVVKQEKFYLKGNQWMVEGNILKWSPKVNLLGLHTLHKIIRLRGRYLTVEKELRLPASVYEINFGTDALWLLLYKYQRFFPFVEAVYGNSAYTFPDAKSQFLIYVTTSGYIIKKVPLK